jgi:toxin ParE1/3/4
MKLVYSPEAQRDRRRIFYESRSRFGAAQAEAFSSRLRTTIHTTILAFPAAGRLRSELGGGVRSYPIVPFVVFYRVEGQRLLVLRILHGRRDIKAPILSLLVAI